MRYKRSGKCPVTGKLSYPTELDAAIALGRAREGRPVKGRDAKVEQRHYRCPHCGDHHLTSAATMPQEAPQSPRESR